MIIQQISSLISQTLTNLQVEKTTEIHLEHPADERFGDYSTNIALSLYHQTDNKSPRELAEKIVAELTKINHQTPHKLLEKIEVAGAGFINFYLSHDYLLDQLTNLAQGKIDISHSTWQHQKVMVEFTDPNPFKEFHIGHLYSNTVGESISRILQAEGAEVKRVDYFGDVGMHVAKSVWGLIKKIEVDPADLAAKLDEKTLKKNYQKLELILQNLAQQPLSVRVKLLGQAYTLGASAYETDENAKQEIKEINFLTFMAGQRRLVEQENWTPQVDYSQFLQQSRYDFAQINLLYQTGRAWSLDYFESIYQRVGMKFDFYFPESEAAEYGIKIVKEYLAKGVFKKSQGAVIFPGSEIGLHDRVFINSMGLPTYEAKELGLPIRKYERFAYDKSIIITGNEINEYFKVLLAALNKINPDLAKKTMHIGHGMVRLPEGKMSSRTGKILTGEWLIEEAQKRIVDLLTESRPEMSAAERFSVAEQVGLAAIKYAFLKSNIGSDIAFNFDESLSFKGNSGPYLQYTYVRCLSILERADVGSDISINKLIDTLFNNKSYLTNQATLIEKNILRYLYQYSEVVETAANAYSPHLICTYVYNLAHIFNTFYAQEQVLTAQSVAKEFRLLMTIAVMKVTKHGLNLLGIEVVNKM